MEFALVGRIEPKKLLFSPQQLFQLLMQESQVYLGKVGGSPTPQYAKTRLAHN